MIEFTLLRLATVLYLAATIAALASLVARRDLPRQVMPGLLLLGLVAHAASVALHSVRAGHLAGTTLAGALWFRALLMVGLFLGLQLRAPLPALGAVVSPLALGMALGADAIYQGARPLPRALQSVWLPVHVGLAILGDAIFALAASASLLYLMQERRLKAHRGGRMLRGLPSLET